LLIFILIL